MGITRRKKGQHLQWEQRLLIERLRLKGLTVREIGDSVGCSYATVSRELRRGQYVHTNSDLTTEERYSPEIAEQQYRAGLLDKGPDVKIGHDHKLAKKLESLVIHKLYSPSTAVSELRQAGWPFAVSICARTVYNYVYNGVLGIDQKHLPMKGKQRSRVRRKKRQQQKRASVGTSIDYRPAEIDERSTFGHWEMDTVYTSKKAALKPALLVLTERVTRQEIIMRIRDRTSGSVIRALNAIERSMGAAQFSLIFRTITVANGSEFADFEGMEKSSLRKRASRTKVYYCHAHRSYERGSNENANRMIRRHLPKGTDFSKVPARKITEIQNWMNNYPRKVLGWQTSNMVYQRYLQELLE